MLGEIIHRVLLAKVIRDGGNRGKLGRIGGQSGVSGEKHHRDVGAGVIREEGKSGETSVEMDNGQRWELLGSVGHLF